MKYSEEMIQILGAFTREMSALPQSFWSHCSVHHIAVLLDVSRETIYAWQKKYPDFSDTIKKWEEKRNALFFQLNKKDGAWIFLAKNWLGMRDKQELEHSGEFDPLKVIITDNGNKPSDGNKPDNTP